MPPWVAFVPRSSSLLRRHAIERLPHTWCLNKTTNASLKSFGLRHASTHISPAAINARPNVLPKNTRIFEALLELGEVAGAYVNISRLQLAQRNLTVQDPVVRVAVLSLNSQRHAQKLARLLLADPLGPEGQWENTLERDSAEDGKAILLRFGDELDAHAPSPLYKILSVPSRILQTHKLEILISTLNANITHNTPGLTTESSQDAILVPKIIAPTARGLPVPYPVHKTLVLADGIERAVEYGRFTSNGTESVQDMVKMAVDLPPPSVEVVGEHEAAYGTVNVNIGTEALAKFRESTANSEFFEQGWFKSGVPDLIKWLVRNLEPTDPIKPALKALIRSIADDVESNITKADAKQLSRLAMSSAPKQTTASILTHVEEWAERSHTELRDQLDEAFTGRNWHKIAWWKLLWRVDDVGMITEEILRGRWLVDAERNAVFLAGRMDQAGFPEVLPAVQEVLLKDSETPPHTSEDRQVLGISTEVKETIPWPRQIAATRSDLLKETVPPLQALAQRLILQTLSTTTLSSALSALLYISMPTFSLFEASAVAALGFVYSLRRMQKLWETARQTWQSEVIEEGRMALKKTEETVKLVVRGQEKVEREDESASERKRAREGVRRVREALGGM